MMMEEIIVEQNRCDTVFVFFEKGKRPVDGKWGREFLRFSNGSVIWIEIFTNGIQYPDVTGKRLSKEEAEEVERLYQEKLAKGESNSK